MSTFTSAHFQLHELADGVFAAIHREGGAAQSNAGIIDLGEQVLIFDTFIAPACDASVHVDGNMLNDGDYAGICALQGRYGMIAIAKENRKYYLVMKGNPGEANNIMGQTCDKEPGEEYERISFSGSNATLKVQMRFDDMTDEATFYYLDSTRWRKIGVNQKLYFGLDHFVGCRFGLFIYSTKKIGGEASFKHFVYNPGEPNAA